MEVGKPQLKNIEQRANAAFCILREEDRVMTKSEIGAKLGISDERSVREVISLLATKKPILSNSSSKGYRLARTESDLADVEHTLAELSSRIEEIQKRMKPLYEFRDRVKFGIEKK